MVSLIRITSPERLKHGEWEAAVELEILRGLPPPIAPAKLTRKDFADMSARHKQAFARMDRLREYGRAYRARKKAAAKTTG